MGIEFWSESKKYCVFVNGAHLQAVELPDVGRRCKLEVIQVLRVWDWSRSCGVYRFERSMRVDHESEKSNRYFEREMKISRELRTWWRTPHVLVGRWFEKSKSPMELSVYIHNVPPAMNEAGPRGIESACRVCLIDVKEFNPRSQKGKEGPKRGDGFKI